MSCEPEQNNKHACPDCRFCQWCGDDRCNLCRNSRERPPKMPLAEQIALYDEINKERERKSS